jgi:hypothetical protein
VSTTQTIPGYDQEAPTESRALQALSELMGQAPASHEWDAACQAAGVRRPVLALDDLRKVADELTHGGALARVAGRSLVIRIASYTTLARNAGLVR